MHNTLTEDRGQNLFTTSTHTGHHWRDGYYFPSSNFQPVLTNPIPPSLNRKDEVTPEVHFKTTNQQVHDEKFPYQDLYNDPVGLRHTKPMANYRVNYISDVVEKLNAKPRRPLTMGYQKSEYKDEFFNDKNDPAYEFERTLHTGPRNYLLRDEIDLGPTRVDFDGREKPVVPARTFDPSEQGVMNLLDPYMTTYNKEHKKWKPSEWNGIAKKDAATIYDTEEYPKTHLGFGTKTNPVPRRDVTMPESNMRDGIWFKTETKHRQVYQPQKRVPNSGMLTENQENYKFPSDVKMKDIKLNPIDIPYTLPNVSSKSVFGTSDMYKTESSFIGKGKIVTIPDMKETNF